MGIKDYLKHLVQDEPNIKPREYSNLYIDCNFMIHYLIYKCKNDFELYTRTFDYFEYVFNTIKVSSTVILVFDGEHDKTFMTNPKQQTHLLRAKYKKESDDYDKQPIYPKSEIISTFKTYMEDIINKYKLLCKMNFKIRTNDDGIEGEADFKILKDIDESDEKNICILSKDSDMVLIAYSLIIKKNLLIDIMINLRPIKFIDVNRIVNLSKPIYNGKKVIESYGPDYVLLTMFLGNDYLPKISNVNYETIFTCYNLYLTHGNNPIISKNKIKKKNLINFITYIVLNKKVKYNKKNIDLDRFKIYYNNLSWSLKHYHILNNSREYIQDTNQIDLEEDNDNDNDNDNKEQKVRIRNVINIYNFINGL